MTGAARFRSMWTDPEFIRLSSYRSWWDWNANGPAVRGPLAPGEDLWSTDPRRALRQTGGVR